MWTQTPSSSSSNNDDGESVDLKINFKILFNQTIKEEKKFKHKNIKKDCSSLFTYEYLQKNVQKHLICNRIVKQKQETEKVLNIVF